MENKADISFWLSRLMFIDHAFDVIRNIMASKQQWHESCLLVACIQKKIHGKETCTAKCKISWDKLDEMYARVGKSLKITFERNYDM